MITLLSDVRHALRQLRRSPAFTGVVVGTLALGIGAVTAVFSVVDGVLLRGLPYPDAERLVRVWHHNTRNEVPKETVSFETFLELVDGVPALEAAAGISPRWSFTLDGPEEPERIEGYWVSASFFELLGAQPVHGRALLAEEDRAGGPPVVVISHGLWQRRFGGDPGIVGEAIQLGAVPATVVGVMPADFLFGEAVDLWLPLAANPIAGNGRQVRWVDVVARMAPGTTVDGARSEVAAFMRSLEETYPEANAGLRETVQGLHTAVVGDVRPALWALLGGVGLVLLITCANISTLLLTHHATRQHEIATRSALGASRGRIVRDALTQSLTLSLLGAVAGAALAFWLLEVFRAVGPAELPRLEEIALDLRVLGAAAGAAVVTGLMVGLSPAVTAVRAMARPALGSGLRSGQGGGGRLRDALVVSQLALALVLLAGAGLLLRSFVELSGVDPGFRADGVLTLQLGVPGGTDGDGRMALYDRLFAEIEALPGVEAAGGTTRLPLGEGVSTRLDIRGRTFADGDQPEVEFRRAGGRYFEAMGIPVLRGRAFDERDGQGAPPVMVVSQSVADRLWPGEDPVGRHVRFWFAGITPDAPWLEVVGVTGDVKQFGLESDSPPIVYVPFFTSPPGSPLIAVRTAGDPTALVGPVRERIRDLAPGAVIWNVESMADRVAGSVAGRRFSLLLVGAFGLLALGLAGVGLYGVIAFGVRSRTREIGIRMALGAAEGTVVRSFATGGLRLAAAGLAIGLATVLLTARAIERLLFGVTPTDPAALAGVVVLLALVGAVASWLPARLAARMNPVEALRHD